MSSPGVGTVDECTLLTPIETSGMNRISSTGIDVELSPSGTLYANLNYGDQVLRVRQDDTSNEGIKPLLPLSSRSLADRTRNPDYGIATHKSKNSRPVINHSSSKTRKHSTIYRTRGSRELRQIASQHATSINELLDELDLIDLPKLQRVMTKDASRLAMSEETPSSSTKEGFASPAMTEEMTAVAVAEDGQLLRQGIEVLDFGNGTELAVSFL